MAMFTAAIPPKIKSEGGGQTENAPNNYSAESHAAL
jgi:hypothetical protein